MEALAHTEELSIPRMEAALGLHDMKANAKVFFLFLEAVSPDRKKCLRSRCCLTVTSAVPVLQTRLRAPVELYKLCVVTTRLASLPPDPSVTADLACFAPLCLPCELHANRPGGRTLPLHAGSIRSGGTSAAAASIIFRGRHFA